MEELNLHQLNVLCTAARLGSFTRAAEALYVGQPAVSQHVAALERALGVALVYRVGRGIRLTEAGSLVVDYGERIARLAEQLQAGIDGLKGLTTGRLVIGTSQTPGDYLLPPVLGEFRRRYPGVSVELEIADTQQVVSWLVRHVYDLGFLGAPADHLDLRIEPFAEDRIVLFVGAGHALASRKQVSLPEVLEAGLLVREPGSATRSTGEATFRAAGLEPIPALELGSNEAVKRAVLAGLGVGMLSAYAIEVEKQAAVLVELPVSAFDCRRNLYMAWHRAAPLGNAQRAFLDLTHELAARAGSNEPRTRLSYGLSAPGGGGVPV
jgi:DNA-binding transcriptional LysR family regulator